MSVERMNHCLPAIGGVQGSTLESQCVDDGDVLYERFALKTWATLSCWFKNAFSFTSFNKQLSPSQLEIACKYSNPFSLGPI